MVLKVYGWPASTCTRTVLATLKEKGVPYEFYVVELLKGKHKESEFIKCQPFGQVPYINDEGFILYESRAIARYIANKYRYQGTPLIPTELYQFALYEQAISMEAGAFTPHASKIVSERLLKKLFNLGPPDESVVSAALASLEKNLDVYEEMLSSQRYIGGDEFTLADVFHLGYGTYLAGVGVDVLESPKRPNVARWWRDISQRPAWKKVRWTL